MKIKRCALAAAVVLTVCTVAFLCWNRSVPEAKSVAEPEPVVEIEVEEKPVVEKESFVKQFVAAVKRIFVKGR